MEKEHTEFTLEVYEPTGSLEVANGHARRLPHLNGETICELSNHMWQDQRTFSALRKALKDCHPNLKIVPFTEFPSLYGADHSIFPKLLRDRGCDAVIVGNAA